MNSEFFEILVPTFIGLSFLWGAGIDLLNLRKLDTKVPEEFVGIYEEDKYAQSQNYSRETTYLSLIRSAFSTLVLLMFYFLGGFSFWNDYVVREFSGEILRGLIYIGGLGAGSYLLGIGFSFYSTFGVEEKYGFNKSTVATFWKDQLLGILLGVLIGAPILAALLWFFQSFESMAWLYAWVALSAIQIFMTFLAPVVIMPLFNKFEPIEEGELKEEVKKYAQSQNFELEGLYKMDGSKRSSKANAFFTGFGKFRRVVLFDTLIEKQSVPELVAVLAHEIGHFKCKHIHKQIIVSLLQTGLMFYILSFFIDNDALAQSFGLAEASTYTGLVFFSFLFSPISEVLNLMSLWMSRKYEFEADHFAVKTYGKAEDLISALKKLSVDSLSNLKPHPLKVFWSYTHPPILERLKALRSLEKQG